MQINCSNISRWGVRTCFLVNNLVLIVASFSQCSSFYEYLPHHYFSNNPVVLSTLATAYSIIQLQAHLSCADNPILCKLLCCIWLQAAYHVCVSVGALQYIHIHLNMYTNNFDANAINNSFRSLSLSQLLVYPPVCMYICMRMYVTWWKPNLIKSGSANLRLLT